MSDKQLPPSTEISEKNLREIADSLESLLAKAMASIHELKRSGLKSIKVRGGAKWVRGRDLYDDCFEVIAERLKREVRKAERRR